ncbi:MAG: class I SAM-dependent methyltransferase [Methanomassiliicoccales archaeon]|nr:class I SAM-dependent methyltransferase [Methanomassiliicoccales archaeon]
MKKRHDAIHVDMLRKKLDPQREHWDTVYKLKPDYFGETPSEFARRALSFFKEKGAKKIIELGCGEGRDTIMFLKEGFEVIAFDYSPVAIEHLMQKAKSNQLSESLTAMIHDARDGIPLTDECVDGIFSHMFFTMQLTEKELDFIFQECLRVMKAGGFNIYSVRNIHDPHYGKGIHRGEDMWESPQKFVVHFFSLEKVKRLARGYEICHIGEFDDPSPTYIKKLYEVILRKPEKKKE